MRSNDGYEASRERNKICTVVRDDEAERDGDLRVVDESGEDYLFAADRFVAIEVPAAVRASLLKTAQPLIARRRRGSKRHVLEAEVFSGWR